MVQPARAVALAGACLIVTLIAPFHTGEVMRALPRLAYWGVLVGVSYSAGYAANILAQRSAPHSLFKRIAIAGPLTGVVVLALVYGLNVASFGYVPWGQELALLAGNVMGISIIIAAIFQVAYASDKAGTEPEQPPALLDRLPFDKRGALVSVSVEDHYVRIRTTKGEDMVLLRLADAIREAQPTKGLQVHRSHWVALDRVTTATRKGDGAIVTLTHGPDIPVSRANVAKLKEAGFLPA